MSGVQKRLWAERKNDKESYPGAQACLSAGRPLACNNGFLGPPFLPRRWCLDFSIKRRRALSGPKSPFLAGRSISGAGRG